MLTLASDFGSPYPAAMRGVILDRTGAVDHVIDVTHRLPRGQVGVGAFWLAQVLPWFPPAVHLAVVDPGVGTDRAALIARIGDHAIVAPDNGLALPAARAIATDDHRVPPRGSRPAVSLGPEPTAAIELFEYGYSEPTSDTFHGRDVFAPAAAAVHVTGVAALEPIDAVTPASSYVDRQFSTPGPGADGVTAEIIAVDDFGNAITNLPGSVVPRRNQLTVDGRSVPFVRSYAATEPGTALVTVGSHENLELAVHDGRGGDAFAVAVGDTVAIEW